MDATVIAQTFDGMKINKRIDIKSISVWIDGVCNHRVNKESLNELISVANNSGQMQIYPNGNIDGFNETPLYTNGQISVRHLEVNGEVVWKR